MRKFILFALFTWFAVSAAASAQTFHEPVWGARYSCSYTNYPGPSTNPGTSVWSVRTRTGSIIWGYETYSVSGTRTDNYPTAWAKPVFHPAPNEDSDSAVRSLDSTVWEFTHGTVQCQKTIVYDTGFRIVFGGCNDGHTAYCRRN